MGIKFIRDDLYDLPERPEPEGGWKKPCTIADHKWAIGIEEGRVDLVCLDPHPEEFVNETDPQRGLPVCIDPYWVSEDLGSPALIPVSVEHIDDSTSAGPWGEAEYGYYIEIKAPGGSDAS